MLKINIIMSLLVATLLTSCSKPSGSPASSAAKTDAKGDVIELDSSPLSVSIHNTGTTPEASTLEIVARKREFNVRPVAIRNTSLVPQDVVVSHTLTNVEVENDCPVAPAQLAPRDTCAYYIYLNRGVSVPAGFDQAIGSITVNGAVIAVSAKLTGPTDLVEATSEISLSKTSVNFGSLNDEQQKKDSITVKNKGLNPLPLVYADLQNIGGGFSATSSCPTSGQNLASRRACVITFTADGEAAGAGDHDIDVEVAGKTVALQAAVTAAPVLTSNPNLTWLNSPLSSEFDMDSSNSSYTFNIKNDSLASQSLMSKDFDFGALSLWPDAFTLENGCSPAVASRKPCSLKVVFDPERFHFGVEFEKDAFIKDEEITVKLTGNSPCNPDHPTPRPDAAYGKKLNANKSACVNNLGVFDDPDSVFGHAVFQ